jgi:hypothetical protein
MAPPGAGECISLNGRRPLTTRKSQLHVHEPAEGRREISSRAGVGPEPPFHARLINVRKDLS